MKWSLNWLLSILCLISFSASAAEIGHAQVLNAEETPQFYSFLSRVPGTDQNHFFWTDHLNSPTLEIKTDQDSGTLGHFTGLPVNAAVFGLAQGQLLVDDSAFYLAVSTETRMNFNHAAILKISRGDRTVSVLAETGYETTSDVYSVQIKSLAQTADFIYWSETPYGSAADGSARPSRIMRVAKSGGTPSLILETPTVISGSYFGQIQIVGNYVYYQEFQIDHPTGKHQSGRIGRADLAGGNPRSEVEASDMADSFRDITVDSVRSTFVVRGDDIYWASRRGVVKTNTVTQKSELVFHHWHWKPWQLFNVGNQIGVLAVRAKTFAFVFEQRLTDAEARISLIDPASPDQAQTVLSRASIIPNIVATPHQLLINSEKGIELVTLP